ncbi:MAG: SH3 domain-containing protein [Proteobacteria bacterium]|nr:SH3 domain-containing protein [Pseudomonadota bacterium]
MNQKIWFVTGLVLLMLLPGVSGLADTMYVRSYKISLMSAPAHRSQKLLTLKRGNKVEKLSTQKNWVKVRFAKREGWVNKLALSKNEPKKRVSLFRKKVDITSKARKRASTFTSAAAARGLMDSGKEKLEIKEGPDFIALAKMEGVEVDVNEAIEFINEDE